MNEELRAIVHTALLTPSPLARYRPTQGRRELHGDVMLFGVGPVGESTGQVLVLGPSAPERVFALATAFYGEGASYSVAVEVESAGRMDAALQAAGWRMDEEEPALVLPQLPAAVPSPPPGLEVRPVADEQGLADFRAIARTPESVVPSLAAALDPGVGLFVCYVDGRPVGTARFTCAGGVADITGVVTVPEERRKGFGTALTWAAIAESGRRGCTAATLTATEMGYPVYLKMGFIPVCTYRTYVPPDEQPE